MKKIILLITAINFLSNISICQTNQKDFPVLKGPYFGQEPPDSIPELFAPEIMNAEAGYHSTIIFSPDMTEAFWSPMERQGSIMYSKIVNGVWSAPEKIYFGSEKEAGEPTFSPDGSKLYFQSFRPPKPGDAERERQGGMQ